MGTSLRGRRAAVVLFSSYPSDPRPRRAAEALIREGMKIDLICLRQERTEPMWDRFGGVEILRVPFQHHRGGKFGYIFRYLAFIALSGWILALRCLTRRYDLVHVHNMPDALVFSALVPKLLGARVILDLHDPMPELMKTIYRVSEGDFSVRLIKWMERRSIAFADAAVTVNMACQKLFKARSCPEDKLQVVMNSPDETLFGAPVAAPARLASASAPFVVMYHGSLIERHGLDLAVEALQTVRRTFPGAVLKIYGQSTPFLDEVMALAQRSNLAEAVHYQGRKSVEEIARAIDECDLGIIPNRRSVFTEINTPTRIFEYLARGKPVIAPRAPGVEDYFNDKQIIFFELGNAQDLARKILFVASSSDEVAEIVRRGQEVYRAHTWSRERERFVRLVTELIAERGMPRRAGRRDQGQDVDPAYPPPHDA